MKSVITIILLIAGLFVQSQNITRYDKDSLQRVRNPYTHDWDLVRRNMDDPDGRFTVKFVKDSFNAVINPYSPEHELNLVRRETVGDGSFIVPFDKSKYNVVNSPFTGYYDLIEKPSAEPDGVLPLILEWDDIANVPVADASSVSDWNTFFGLPTNGTPFDSVTISGNIVNLYGGGDITLTNGGGGFSCGDGPGNTELFESNPHIKGVDDQGGAIAAVGAYCFLGYDESCESVVSILEYFHSTTCASFGEQAFRRCESLESVSAGVVHVGNWAFDYCLSMTQILIPSCVNLGSDCAENSVFNGINGLTITLTCDASLLTCNGGAPDGDLCMLATNNTLTVNGSLLTCE